MQPKHNNEALWQESHLVVQQLLAMIDYSPGLEIQQFALESMVRLTASTVGFIYAIDSQAKTARLENMIKSGQESRFIPWSPTENLADGGLWSPCLTTALPPLCPVADILDPVLGNLHSGLVVPVHNSGELVAVIGVANGAVPYQKPDSEVLLEMASALGRVVVRKKLHDSMPDDIK